MDGNNGLIVSSLCPVSVRAENEDEISDVNCDNLMVVRSVHVISICCGMGVSHTPLDILDERISRCGQRNILGQRELSAIEEHERRLLGSVVF